jgi:hypothetical protein
MKLKPFGSGGSAIEHGDLEFHIGWIEALVRDEEQNVTGKGPKAKRLEKVQEALALLHEAAGLSA